MIWSAPSSERVGAGFLAVWTRLREERWDDAAHNLRALAPLLGTREELWAWHVLEELGEIVAPAGCWPTEELRALAEIHDERLRKAA